MFTFVIYHLAINIVYLDYLIEVETIHRLQKEL